jgi:hypothetical protein
VINITTDHIPSHSVEKKDYNESALKSAVNEELYN